MMFPPDPDRALWPDDGQLYLLHDSTRNHDGRGPRANQFQNNIGSIEIVRPLRETESDPANAARAAICDDGLSATRGMLLGVVLGVGIWCMVGGLIGIFIF